MKQFLALCDFAEQNGISIDCFDLPENEALSIMDHDGSCHIAIDAHKLAVAEEKVCLAHEVGHCVTGSFYNDYSPLDLRDKHECTANRWAYNRLLPYEQLMEAVNRGLTEVWEIAELFELPEKFTADAIEYYQSFREAQ